jgi:MinD-like ATPase involved in chromosome partitioning or flagellar assembly
VPHPPPAPPAEQSGAEQSGPAERAAAAEQAPPPRRADSLDAARPATDEPAARPPAYSPPFVHETADHPSGDVASADHPTAEYPTGEQAAPDYPTAGYPTGYPDADQPAADFGPFTHVAPASDQAADYGPGEPAAWEPPHPQEAVYLTGSVVPSEDEPAQPAAGPDPNGEGWHGVPEPAESAPHPFEAETGPSPSPEAAATTPSPPPGPFEGPPASFPPGPPSFDAPPSAHAAPQESGPRAPAPESVVPAPGTPPSTVPAFPPGPPGAPLPAPGYPPAPSGQYPPYQPDVGYRPEQPYQPDYGYRPEQVHHQLPGYPPAPPQPPPPQQHPRPQQGEPAYQAEQPSSGPPLGYTASLELSSDRLLRQQGPVAGAGWRKTVRQATFGKVKLKPSNREVAERELVERVRTPVHGCHRIAVISLKGGVGKTTTTTALGSTLASLRGDRVIAIDANPDAGTLGRRVRRETNATIRDLLLAVPTIQSYVDIRRFTSQAPSRLEILANDVDPAVSTTFNDADYRKIVDLLGKQYSIVLTDSGTGLLYSAMRGVLELAHSLIVVSTPSVDGATSASTTLDWLCAHGYEDLVRRSVTVISGVRETGKVVIHEQLVAHFEARTRAVVTVPFDPHLATGAELDLELLRPASRQAYLRLAGLIAEEFARQDVANAPPGLMPPAGHGYYQPPRT